MFLCVSAFFELLQDARGKVLAQFHSPLVIGVYGTENKLNKYVVLVELEQFAQVIVSKLVHQKGIGRVVAG